MDLHSLNMGVGSVVRSSMVDQESLFTVEFGKKTGWRTQEYTSPATWEDAQQLARHLEDVRSYASQIVGKKIEILILHSRASIHESRSSLNDNGLLPSVDTAMTPTEINNLSTSISSLESEIAQLETELETARRAAKDVLETHPNIIIATWNDQKVSNTALKVNPFGSASYDESKTQTGYVVIAGFRHVRLVIGDDFQEHMSANPGHHPQSGWFSHSGGIVTAAFEARHTAYFSSTNLEQRIDYFVTATGEELAGFFGAPIDPTLLARVRVELSGYLARVQALESQGCVTASTGSRFDPAPPYDSDRSADPVRDQPSKKWSQLAACVTHSRYLVDRSYLEWD